MSELSEVEALHLAHQTKALDEIVEQLKQIAKSLREANMTRNIGG